MEAVWASYRSETSLTPLVRPVNIMLQGDFDEGFIEPHFWAIVSTLIILAAASIFALVLFFKWLRNRPRPVGPAPRGFPVKTKEDE